MKTGECPHSEWAPLHAEVRDYEHGASTPVAFVRCRACELVRQDPPPTPESLRATYPADYRAHLSTDDASPLARAVASLKAVQAELLLRQLRGLLPRKSAPILEIGCGAGHLLRRLHAKGFTDLHGVDREPALGRPLEALGIRYTACDLDEGLSLEGRYDTIIMHNVVEHLAHPERVLEACARLLEPRGQLLLFTPNTASLSHRVFGPFWSGLHAPRHVLLHRPSTIRAVGRSLGFERVDVSFPTDPGSWALSAQNVVEARHPAGAPLRYGTKPYTLGLLPLFYPVALAESALGRGSSMLARLVSGGVPAGRAP